MSDSNDRQSVDRTRRTLLGLVGGGAAVGLAGCLGDGDEGNGNGDTPTETPMENGDDDMENGDDDMATPTETPSEDDMSEDDDGGNGQDGPPEEALGGELNSISATINTFDPIQSTDTASASKLGEAYENLTHYPNGETRLENQLVEEVKISDDLLTYTFSIKQGVPYHDNPIKDELTAHDFKYAWRRLAESSATSRANFILQPGFLGIDHETDEENGVGVFNVAPDTLAVEVVDDYTLEMTLSEVEPAALDILAYDSFGAMPEGLVGDIEGYDGEYSQEEIAAEVMVGTGAFQFESWESGSEVRMTAFDDYWGEGPYLDSLHWAVIEEDEAAYGVSRRHRGFRRDERHLRRLFRRRTTGTECDRGRQRPERGRPRDRGHRSQRVTDDRRRVPAAGRPTPAGNTGPSRPFDDCRRTYRMVFFISRCLSVNMDVF